MARQRTNRESRGKQMCSTGCRRREHLGHPPPGRQVACPMPTTRPPAENRNGDVEAARGHDDEVALTSAQGVSERQE